MDVPRLPASLTTIETEALDGIAAEVIIILEDCITIEPKAFVNCQYLLYVIILSGVEIPDDVFTR